MQNDDLALLAQAFLKLRNIDEIKIFLKDLLSNSEQESIASRVVIAQMLEQGLPYTQIERETGASSATIAKVSENLKYGNDGYKLILERLKRK
ncbi:MAG TPA: YerC/YecD family TrpR-related protein [Candidatus Dojkabacteria bacterium]|nr:YerC/YecD family TrpR-related protein [Candidatus Dojkabacteria bacterium]